MRLLPAVGEFAEQTRVENRTRMYDFQSVPAHYTKAGLVILHFRFPARPICALAARVMVTIAAAATNALGARRRSGRVIPACRRSGAVPIPAPFPYIAANIIEGEFRMTLLLESLVGFAAAVGFIPYIVAILC